MELEKIRIIKKKIEKKILDIPGVKGIDIGKIKKENDNSEKYIIRVYVKKQTINLVEAIHKYTNGIDVEIIERKFEIK